MGRPRNRTARTLGLVIAVLWFLRGTTGDAQVAGSDSLIRRIEREPADTAAIAETLFQLTDAIGPRTVGSASLRAAESWLTGRLRELGLERVRIEPNPPMDVGNGLTLNPPGWAWSRLTVQQLAPWPQTLVGVPVLFSPSTRGRVTGEAVIAPLPRYTPAAVDSFVQRHRGRLRGKLALLADAEVRIAAVDSVFRRYSAAQLEAMEKVTPSPPPARRPSSERAPDVSRSGTPPPVDPFAQQNRVFEFLREEGVLALVGAAPTGSGGGTLRLRATPTPPRLADSPPPMFDLTPEHFNRLIRLTKRNLPVRLEVQLESSFGPHSGTENVLAELRGGDKADEVVIVGAHLDSWHGGTGATDNAVGVTTVLEAVRILTAIRAPLRRSVLVAFWGGEEFGLAGSRAFVRRYAADQAAKVSGYLNLDYGSGRIRGVYLQGNARLKPLFDGWLSGVGDGSLVATLQTTLGSDQASFERVGIPGLSFIQDPLNYEHGTHHTTMDVGDYVVMDDVRDNATILAGVIARVANADHLLPRNEPR